MNKHKVLNNIITTLQQYKNDRSIALQSASYSEENALIDDRDSTLVVKMIPTGVVFVNIALTIKKRLP